MRIPTLIAMSMLAATAAQAQTSVYYAERGHWTVMNYPAACRAINRPMVDFNYAPFATLQITVRPKSVISVDVFFWPSAVMMDREYELRLRFTSGGDLTLPARPTLGDYVLASDPDVGLWRKLQDSKMLGVGVVGEPALALQFTLDGIDWVLNALTTCAGTLPRE